MSSIDVEGGVRAALAYMEGDVENPLTKTAAGLATVAAHGKSVGFPAVGAAATAFAVLALAQQAERIAAALEQIAAREDLRR